MSDFIERNFIDEKIELFAQTGKKIAVQTKISALGTLLNPMDPFATDNSQDQNKFNVIFQLQWEQQYRIC